MLRGVPLIQRRRGAEVRHRGIAGCLCALALGACSPVPLSLTAALEQAQASLSYIEAHPTPGATMFACQATITYQVGVTGGLATRLGLLPPTLTVGGTSGSTIALQFDSPQCEKMRPDPGDKPVLAR